MARLVTTRNEAKLEALRRIKDGEDAAVLAAEYRVSRVTLWRWQRDIDKIAASNPAKVFVGKKVGHKVGNKETEDRLVAWIKLMRREKFLCISTECLRIALARLDPEFVRNRTEKATM